MGLGPGYASLDTLLSMRPNLCWALDSQYKAGDLSVPPLYVGAAGGGIAIGGLSGGPDRGSPTLTATAFDGVDDRISSPYAAFINGTVRSFAGWAYRTSTAPNDCVLGATAAGFAPPELFVASGTNDVYFYPDGTAGSPTLWPGAWKTAQWMHWALVFDEPGNLISLYINGALVSTQAQNIAYNAAPGNLLLGAYSSAISNPFNGSMHSFAVFERGLKSGEPAALWKAGAAGSGSGGDGLPGDRWA